MDKFALPPSDWQLPDFQIEELQVRGHAGPLFGAQQWLAQTVERLCEQAKGKGPNVQLVLGSLGFDSRNMTWQLPYAFVTAPAHVRPGWQVFGPFPAD